MQAAPDTQLRSASVFSRHLAARRSPPCQNPLDSGDTDMRFIYALPVSRRFTLADPLREQLKWARVVKNANVPQE